MGYEGKKIQGWMDLVDKMNEEKKEVDPMDKINKDIEKTDSKIMVEKIKKLNMLVKKKYYDSGKEVPEEKMFQFSFEDKGTGYEFTIPLNILFGKKTQAFCAKYWEDFFDEADIRTTFSDNINASLKQIGNLSLTMTLNKSLTKEVGDEEQKKEAEEAKETE